MDKSNGVQKTRNKIPDKKNSINPLKIINVLQAYRVIRMACQSQPDIQKDPYKYYLKSRTKFYS